MNTDHNIMLLTDSYKPSHAWQLPPGMRYGFSFLESRGGLYPETMSFGYQPIFMKYMLGQVVTEEKIERAKRVLALHFRNDKIFNEAGWRYILREHGGRLPLEIRAVPEGKMIPNSNVLMTVVNTDPDNVPWLGNYLESLLVQVWYPMTVGTQDFNMKKDILRYLVETGTPEDIDFKLHDFGFRGSTSVESAGIGGSAHLVNFLGTDNLEAIEFAHQYYGEEMAGFSIPASEHSTITSWGRERELDAYRNMLTQFPTGHVAVVSDSYDIFHANDKLWGVELRDKVLQRDGVVVIRPDSGNAPEVLPKLLEILGRRFGYSDNRKGYKVLDPHVRLIQGDGIKRGSPAEIYERMKQERWSADNLNFGSGGGLLQEVNRDTQKIAFKCSAVDIDGTWHGVMKDPVTDHGKRSKAGRLALLKEEGKYRTVQVEDAHGQNELVPVYRNGELLVRYTLADIRKRALA